MFFGELEQRHDDFTIFLPAGMHSRSCVTGGGGGGGELRCYIWELQSLSPNLQIKYPSIESGIRYIISVWRERWGRSIQWLVLEGRISFHFSGINAGLVFVHISIF